MFNLKIIYNARWKEKADMLTYSLENIGSDKLYEHLYKLIKGDIIHKVLAAGEKLPSKRELAKNLGVSIITVETAYSQLMAEGYIYSVDRKGFFVSEIDDEFLEDRQAEADVPDISCYSQEYYGDFVKNTVPVENFPFSTWMKLLKEVTADTDKKSLLSMEYAAGIPELKNAVVKHLNRFRGMEVMPEQIVVGAGTEYLYGVLVQLLGRDKVFGIENPGYQRMAKIYGSNDVDIRFIDMDNEGVIPEKVEKNKVDVLHISPSHHFPTGIVMPIGRRYELLGWAAKNNSGYIIEDDYDCEFRLYGKPVPALQSVDKMDKVIYINTFSKSLAPAFRISYMVLPMPLLKKYYDNLGFYSCTVSAYEQHTLARFINDGYFERHINRMRNHYRSQRDRMVNIIKNSDIAEYLEVKNADEGLHFLIDIKKDISDSELKMLAGKNGINIACLSDYFHSGECNRHAIVLSYSGVNEERVDTALKKLLFCIESLLFK